MNPPETQYRTLAIEVERADPKQRTVEASLSSEEPIPRHFGTETLSHDLSAVDLTRAKQGLPLLWSHDASEQVGVVERIRIAGNKLRGVLRFGNSARAKELYQDVIEGIARSLSIGYSVNEFDTTRQGRLITSWTPMEVSIVSVPADVTVGIGRSHEDTPGAATRSPKEALMPQNNDPAFVPKRNREQEERDRAASILKLGQKYKMEDEAQQAVIEGTSLRSFQEWLDRPTRRAPATMLSSSSLIGMNDEESVAFSFRKLILAQATKDWSHAGLEREACRATGPGNHGGIIIPFDVLMAPIVRSTATQHRDLTTSTAGSLVPTDHLAQSFIQVLRDRTIIRQLGATVLSNLEGDVSIPRQTNSGTVGWVTEGSDLSETAMTVDSVSLSPKSVGAFQDFSRRLMLQASPEVEQLIRQDLASTVAFGVDDAAFNGTGGAQPTGLLNLAGVQTVSLTSNDLDWPAVVQLEGAVASSNADTGRLGYATNSAVRSKLKRTIKDDGTTAVDQMIWEEARLDANGFGSLNGYPVAVSNIIPSNLGSGDKSAMIFGDFSSLILGEWAQVEIAVDPSALFLSGGIRVRVFYDVDLQVRHVESFAKVIDAATV